MNQFCFDSLLRERRFVFKTYRGDLPSRRSAASVPTQQRRWLQGRRGSSRCARRRTDETAIQQRRSCTDSSGDLPSRQQFLRRRRLFEWESFLGSFRARRKLLSQPLRRRRRSSDDAAAPEKKQRLRSRESCWRRRAGSDDDAAALTSGSSGVPP